MPIQDRTKEFQACVQSIRNRSSTTTRSSEARQRLLQERNAGSKSEFTKLASGIGKDISNTTLKLNKLAQRTYFIELCEVLLTRLVTVAKRKTLFDDRPVEISVSLFICAAQHLPTDNL